jgi:hypothetical protein
MLICRKEIFKTIIEVVGMIMPLNDDRPFDDFSREPLNYKENVCREAPRFSNKEVPAVGSKFEIWRLCWCQGSRFQGGKCVS